MWFDSVLHLLTSALLPGMHHLTITTAWQRFLPLSSVRNVSHSCRRHFLQPQTWAKLAVLSTPKHLDDLAYTLRNVICKVIIQKASSVRQSDRQTNPMPKSKKDPRNGSQQKLKWLYIHVI